MPGGGGEVPALRVLPELIEAGEKGALAVHHHIADVVSDLGRLWADERDHQGQLLNETIRNSSKLESVSLTYVA